MCYHVLFLRSEQPSHVSREGDLCEKCQRYYTEETKVLRSAEWKDRVVAAIQTARPGNTILWDLFALSSDNGAWGKPSEFSTVLASLDAYALTELKNWLDENRNQAIEHYGDLAWRRVRTLVGVRALLAPLPPNMQLLPDTHDGLPFQIGAVRADGKTWNLNIPIRAKLLRQSRRHFGERGYAKLLGMSRRAYRRLRDAITDEGFSLDRFTAEVLYRITYGKKRGPTSDK